MCEGGIRDAAGRVCIMKRARGGVAGRSISSVAKLPSRTTLRYWNNRQKHFMFFLIILKKCEVIMSL